MSRAPSTHHRRGPLLVAGGLLCGATWAGVTGTASAELDPDRTSELAQAQFQVYLLTNTNLRPSNITCTLPNGIGAAGDLICYAFVNERETITALASPDGELSFSFAAITKAGGGPGTPGDAPATAPGLPDELGEFADASDYMQSFDDDAAYLAASIADYAGIDVDVLAIEWQPDFDTLYIEVDSGDHPIAADKLAWIVTDTIAVAWEYASPVRADDAAVHPRLEVVADGQLYGTPFDVMVAVADFEISAVEWLQIATTGAAGFDASVASADPGHRDDRGRSAGPANEPAAAPAPSHPAQAHPERAHPAQAHPAQVQPATAGPAPATADGVDHTFAGALAFSHLA